MNTNIFFKKIVGKFRRKQSLGENPVPRRVLLHWKIIVILFALAVGGVFFNGFLTYRDISRGDFLRAAKTNPANLTPVTAETLNAVADYFANKSASFDKLLSSRESPIDPSR